MEWICFCFIGYNFGNKDIPNILLNISLHMMIEILPLNNLCRIYTHRIWMWMTFLISLILFLIPLSPFRGHISVCLKIANPFTLHDLYSSEARWFAIWKDQFYSLLLVNKNTRNGLLLVYKIKQVEYLYLYSRFSEQFILEWCKSCYEVIQLMSLKQ
jgi:hypothetical protein